MNSTGDGNCKYSDIFGKPRTGVHGYRLFDIAIVDVVLTVILGIFISKVSGLNTFAIIVFCFLVGIIAHRIFCVKTKIDSLIFGN